MSRTTRTPAAVDANNDAPAAAAPKSDDFNGADRAAFDHDGDGEPGGSLPVLRSAVLLSALDNALDVRIPRGVVVLGSADRIADLVSAGQARPATATDVAVAGPTIRTLA